MRPLKRYTVYLIFIIPKFYDDTGLQIPLKSPTTENCKRDAEKNKKHRTVITRADPSKISFSDNSTTLRAQVTPTAPEGFNYSYEWKLNRKNSDKTDKNHCVFEKEKTEESSKKVTNLAAGSYEFFVTVTCDDPKLADERWGSEGELRVFPGS